VHGPCNVVAAKQIVLINLFKRSSLSLSYVFIVHLINKSKVLVLLSILINSKYKIFIYFFNKAYKFLIGLRLRLYKS
jgi:hypothetical protein